MTLLEQLDATITDDPGPGGWEGGFANKAHWNKDRVRVWRCWASTGPHWGNYCAAEVSANDGLGLCPEHRELLLDSVSSSA